MDKDQFQLRSAVIGTEGGHQAGRQLLQAMYEESFGKPMPEILVTDRGKPYFADGCVHFSISHTKNRVFCALSEKNIGIEAEEKDRDIRLELADKILSSSEKRYFEQSENKKETLLRLWVLKEAAAKHTGQGLQGYPDHTDFSPDDPRILQIDGCFVAIITEL